MSTPFRVCCIVEGHGEVQSVPALIHRICLEQHTAAPLVPRPIRWDRHKLAKPGETERAVRLAVLSAKATGGVLMLADADDDCVAELGPQLLERARQAANGIPVAVSFTCREYESWFLAAAESFQNFHGLPADLTPPADAEQIRGAKEWLRKSTGAGNSYRPGVDQLLFTRRLDLKLARRSRSFCRFERELLGLLERLSQ